jgi:hypothetical protein
LIFGPSKKREISKKEKEGTEKTSTEKTKQQNKKKNQTTKPQTSNTGEQTKPKPENHEVDTIRYMRGGFSATKFYSQSVAPLLCAY